MGVCLFCGREFESNRGSARHSAYCSKNPNRKLVYPGTGKRGSNQWTKAKETGVDFVYNPKSGEKAQETRIKNGTNKHSEETKKKISKSMKLAVVKYPESYTSSNRGRTKQIEKYGIKFQGSWELRYYEHCLSKGILIERCKEHFPYEWNGTRSYNPDFYLPETDTYVEVKGYETDRDRAKWRDFPKTLIVIKSKELKELAA